jgi:hypothetical protein
MKVVRLSALHTGHLDISLVVKCADGRIFVHQKFQ